MFSPPLVENLTLTLDDEASTLACGAHLFKQIDSNGLLIFLHGNLGAGKTTLVRGLLRASGYMGPVKSPTFTLVEEYFCNGLDLFHFDLYRLNDPEELEWIGIRDYVRSDSVCLIEWPERGEGQLPIPDIDITLTIKQPGRSVRFSSQTLKGLKIVKALQEIEHGYPIELTRESESI